MAKTCHLKDGSMEVILGDRYDFLERLIRENLGDDAAHCFADYVDELKEDLSVVSDTAEDHERSADGYLQMCHEACDAFLNILDLLDAPRLDRKALKAAAEEGYNDLNNNL